MNINENSTVRVGEVIHIVPNAVAAEMKRLQNIEQAAQITRLVLGHVIDLVRSAAGAPPR